MQAPEEAYDDSEEQCLIKLNNYRAELNVDADGKPLNSARTGVSAAPMDAALAADGSASAEPEAFNPDKIPPKIPFVKPLTSSGLQTNTYHSEAPYSLRKILIEQGRKTFKELEKTDVNALLIHSSQRQRMLEDILEETLIKDHGYGRGCQYQDSNTRITFKTFLQE